MSRPSAPRALARFAPTHASRQLGFSLIELMIGLTIGLIVATAGVMVYSSNVVTSKAVAEQNRIEETSRYLVSLTQAKFNAAGYFGCQSRGGQLQNNINGASASFLYNFSQPVYAHQNTAGAWSPALDSSLSSAVPPPLSTTGDNDVLVVRSSSGPVLPLSSGHAAPGSAGDIYVAANTYLGPTVANSVALVTNCTKATAFVNTASAACVSTAECLLQHALGSSPGVGNARTDLGYNFGIDSEIIIPATTAYYVAPSSRCSAAGSGCPANASNSLYRKVGSAPPEELAENVQAMKVTLFVDDGSGTGSANASKTPSAVTDWTQVVGFNVDFLVNSSAPLLPSNASVVFNGSTYSDRYARRIVSVKAGVRNQTK